MSETYLIDGYNLLHKIPELQRAADANLEQARDALTAQVAQWCDARPVKVSLFFDGRGRHSDIQKVPGHGENFTVTFTSHEKTADSLIERAVYTSSKKDSVIVVSADRGITDLCLGMGALTMSPDHFLTLMGDSAQQVRDSMALRKKNDDGFGRMDDQLDSGSMDALKRLRDELE